MEFINLKLARKIINEYSTLKVASVAYMDVDDIMEGKFGVSAIGHDRFGPKPTEFNDFNFRMGILKMYEDQEICDAILKTLKKSTDKRIEMFSLDFSTDKFETYKDIQLYVLLHEIGHMRSYKERGLEFFLADEEKTDEMEYELEKEADIFAVSYFDVVKEKFL